MSRMPLGSLPQTSPGRVGGLVEKLTPGYFALVMASGIISIGLNLSGFRALSIALLVVCIVSYVVLVVLNLWRFVGHRPAMIDDFRDPKRAFGFFTFVAGTNVLGTRIAAGLAQATGLAAHGVVPRVARPRLRHPVERRAGSVRAAGRRARERDVVHLGRREPVGRRLGRDPRGRLRRCQALLAILAVFSWSVGVFLYAASAIIVSLRIMLYELDPKDFDPPYWVSMGAVAITVVAGARIVEMDAAPMVDATRGLIAGLSVVFWAFATWLIPVLVAAGVWRHFVRNVPLVYVPTLWSMIFPLGMYAVAGSTWGAPTGFRSSRRSGRTGCGWRSLRGHRLRSDGPQRQPSARHPPTLRGRVVPVPAQAYGRV